MNPKKKSAKSDVNQSTSVRLPEELLTRIDEMAAADSRTRGNLIRLLLEQAMEGTK